MSSSMAGLGDLLPISGEESCVQFHLGFLSLFFGRNTDFQSLVFLRSLGDCLFISLFWIIFFKFIFIYFDRERV